MKRKSPTAVDLFELVIEHIDIPKSLYEKAAARHRSVGEFLQRDSSTVREFEPDIRPQGSFRFGTVVRPLNHDDEYDLDNVCVLTTLTKGDMTQEQLKELYGAELKKYARQQNMLTPVEECNRCWRLHYADEENFHLDSLPCVPDDETVIARLQSAGVARELAKRAVAITDGRHPQYTELTPAWLSSNPRGFAKWFEGRAALGRQQVVQKGIRAAVEDVPPYEWKTPLQRCIQLLKRHRDVMFRDERELAPISMIITNLAARAYQGESDIHTALVNIVTRMPDSVRSERPRVPNPADPAEDYADKWSKDPRLEKSFWDWYHALKADIARVPRLLGTAGLPDGIERMFDVKFTREQRDWLVGTSTPVHVAPAIVVPAATRPWGVND